MKNRNSIPPKFAGRILERFLRDDLLEEVLGDLEEKFYRELEAGSPLRAKLNYWYQVFNYLRPFAIRKQKTQHLTAFDMYRNHFKTSYRNIARHKAFSMINISGLALGMTCFLLIYLWVRDERNINNFHSNGPNMFAVYQSITSGVNTTGSYSTPLWYAENGFQNPFEDLPDVVPEVSNVVFYATGYELPWGHPETFRLGDKIYKLEGSRASKDFFKIFDYNVLYGDPASALADLSNIAISRKMAQLFFDSPEQAIGRTLRYENRIDFTVAAVFEDIPDESTLKFDFLINWESHVSRLEWASHIALTTVILKEGADVRAVEEKINTYLLTRLPEDDVVTKVGLQKFSEMYLVSCFENGRPSGGRIEYIGIFGAVAIFILIIACTNFMNLSTARAVRRSKEIAVRKVIGSARSHLVAQFLTESVLISAIAMVVSVLLVLLVLPMFNGFTGKGMTLPVDDPFFWGILLGLVFTSGLFSGSYPALFLSSMKPLRILKGTLHFSFGATWFREGLVVFQFGTCILLLISTMVISRQINYVQRTHLGYDQENLISVRIEGNLNKDYQVFKDKLLAMPGISGVDRSSEAPQDMGFLVSEPINWEGKSPDEEVVFKPASVGFDFIHLMNLEVVEGRGFSRKFSTDTSAFMINEVALKEMGITDPIGKWISAWDKRGPIIGILKDYHTGSLRESIKPLIIDVKENLYFGVILLKVESGKMKEALLSLDEVCREINPEYPLEYEFLDQEYGQLYQNERVMGKLSNVFAGISVVISCLGLLGLALFSAEQRTKEIGIRKVLGASLGQIVAVFTGTFMKLIAMSFVLAAPISWYLMNNWLEGFAYRTNLSWWIFCLTGLFALFLGMLTVSIQAIKTALANPVNSLRSE